MNTCIFGDCPDKNTIMSDEQLATHYLKCHQNTPAEGWAKRYFNCFTSTKDTCPVCGKPYFYNASKGMCRC